ncbi:right-handed parallel beta-helix repeat-containing protein, partial [bacterium]|nr:right-handed parallel beta-helix repeat-containing protein [bacterium]
MKILPIVAMVTVGFLPLSFPATAATIHVPDEQLTIQAGIDAASYGDTVLVASGTYYEHTITMKSGVYLTSETGHADCVTIDAQQQGRVFYCDGVDGLASIVGFTVTGGTSDLSWGGGMYCRQSSPTLTNCTFSGNRARYGGGMYCRESSSPTLTGCTFSDNEGNWGGGGGMACANSSPTLTNCTFSGNDAAEYGGGMYCTYSSPTLTGCTFSSNYSHYEGGGLCCYYSAPTLTECTLSNNDAAQRGGGMHCWYSSPALAGCTFSGNGANVGGGMYCREDSSSPTLTDC